jgi:hypothetical protein
MTNVKVYGGDQLRTTIARAICRRLLPDAEGKLLMSAIATNPRHLLASRIAGAALVIWLIMLCVLPDPRPLGAPEWAVRAASRAGRLGGAETRRLLGEIDCRIAALPLYR